MSGRASTFIALGAEARRLAERIHRMLRERDMAGDVDRPACELLADALLRLRQARRVLDREGIVVRVRTRSGGEAIWPHPAYRVLSAERAAILSLLRQLGMTPRARGDVRRLGARDVLPDLDEILGLDGGS